MQFSLVRSRALHGARAAAVRVEVHLANGLPGVAIVGLPDTEVRESRERVRAALQNSGFTFPNQRITVNLAPADLPKGSGRFDLPIAIGIAAASGQLPGADLSNWEFSGELSLDGSLLSSPGAFALALSARESAHAANTAHPAKDPPGSHGSMQLRASGHRPGQSDTDPAASPRIMLSPADAAQAACIPGIRAYGAPNLLAACAHLVGHGPPLQVAQPDALESFHATSPDMADVRGQAAPRRALEIAAAGAHNLLMVGPPGSGKSMLAQRLPGLLPPMSEGESLEAAALRSLKGLPLKYGMRPFEAPHHNATQAAVVGGGNPPQPGCITMAHHGVLFMDEVLEFDRKCLEALREPLETGEVHLARAGRCASFPARFQWVVAHNPCPCGWLGHPVHACRCSADRIRRYRERLSGPLMDRIDIGVEVAALSPQSLLSARQGEASCTIRERVAAARALQIQRQGKLNANLSVSELEGIGTLPDALRPWFAKTCERLGLSGRATHRILRVARSIADLEAVSPVTQAHLLEAISLRKVLMQTPDTQSVFSNPTSFT